eukprot:GHRQ01024249.1.p1 GENE.GHRQ01024249.1~~GHRQ01024249.1.p1  ORF type:complete len:184 (+),score=70.51 GHRQ01024249.1:136-687(+)
MLVCRIGSVRLCCCRLGAGVLTGDSVALLARGGGSQRLSVAHRMDDPREAERVLAAGGRVARLQPGATPRVMGTSNQTRFKGSMVTRSLGDFAFKHPQALLSAEPHVTQQELAPSDSLLLLASDGVTDVMPDDDVLGAALRALQQVGHSWRVPAVWRQAEGFCQGSGLGIWAVSALAGFCCAV